MTKRSMSFPYICSKSLWLLNYTHSCGFVSF